VARWTSLHVRRLTDSIVYAMNKRGFSFIEVLAPCPPSFGRRNKMRKALDLVKFYHERSVVRNNLDPREAVLDFNEHLIVGEFVDIDRPTFLDNYQAVCRREIGEWPRLERKSAPEDKRVAG
jgi:2-oxoglutarate ferredoxin oxidoreductase subunit beta